MLTDKSWHEFVLVLMRERGMTPFEYAMSSNCLMFQEVVS